MKQAIQKAAEGGYHEGNYRGRIKIHPSHYNEVLLDPLFWQALGKAMGWEDTLDYQAIGRLIRDERENIGLTQKELGKTLGYSGMGISHFENGIREIKTDTLQKLCEFFKKEPMFFIKQHIAWRFHWHRFIDHLAEGKSPDDFFNQLLR